MTRQLIKYKLKSSFINRLDINLTTEATVGVYNITLK
jgi:hypothetical protein